MRKVRCKDAGSAGPCSRCIHLSLACTFDLPSSARGPKRRWVVIPRRLVYHSNLNIASKIFRPYGYRTKVLSLTYRMPHLLQARPRSLKLPAPQDYTLQMILARTLAALQQRQPRPQVQTPYMPRTRFALGKWFYGCWTISSPLSIP